jgi:hypothetical protein
VDTAHDNPNGGSLMYWISGGVYDVTDEADKANAKPSTDTTIRPIPWVIK